MLDGLSFNNIIITYRCQLCKEFSTVVYLWSSLPNVITRFWLFSLLMALRDLKIFPSIHHLPLKQYLFSTTGPYIKLWVGAQVCTRFYLELPPKLYSIALGRNSRLALFLWEAQSYLRFNSGSVQADTIWASCLYSTQHVSVSLIDKVHEEPILFLILFFIFIIILQHVV